MARKPRQNHTAAEVSPSLLEESRFHAALGSVASLSLQGSRLEIRRALREMCPTSPGVYGIADPLGQVIYVGMSRRLQSRLLTYFSSKVRRKKETRLGHRARTLLWQPAAHELVARLRERELIRQLRPNSNVQGHPTRMRLGYLVFTGQSAAGFQLRGSIPRTHQGVWGPIPMTSFMRNAVEALNHHFRLRDCPSDTPMMFRGELSPLSAGAGLPCLRGDLGTCLSPCIGACTRTTYQRAVTAARAFLDGRSAAPLETLETDMALAVVERRYEQAARIRDRRDALTRLNLHLRRFHDWQVQANFVYPIESEPEGTPYWLLVVRGDVRHICPRPTTSAAKADFSRIVAGAERQLQGERGETVITGPDEFIAGRLLHRWFRIHEEERTRCRSLAQIRHQCRPAGKRSGNSP